MLGLRAHVAQLQALIHALLQAHPVAHDEEDDEGQDGRHDQATDDDHDGAAEELRLHEVAAKVLRIGGEVNAAHHTCSCERRHGVVVNGQNAKIVRGSCCQVVDRDAFAGRRNHSARNSQQAVNVHHSEHN